MSSKKQEDCNREALNETSDENSDLTQKGTQRPGLNLVQ